jgi:large subunit ribosomal protein L5
MARLKDRYVEEIAPSLRERFGIENPMRVPRLEKIVVNMGVGEAAQNSRALDGAMEDLARITGQKAQLRRARKSVAGFKIREGMPVGARVTLRGERMWEFLDRLISVALPRVRDFRGVSPNSFDGHGNYALGLREQLIFPEISYDAIDATRGLDVAVVTTTVQDLPQGVGPRGSDTRGNESELVRGNGG